MIRRGRSKQRRTTHRAGGTSLARDWRNFFGLLSPAVGAMVRKEYFYLVRNGFAFLLLILPPVQVLFFTSQFAGKHPIFGGRGVSVDTFFPGMMAYTILVLMGPAYNIFAYEGRGIQTYFMAPLRFEDIFLGKNLVSAAIIACELDICSASAGVANWTAVYSRFVRDPWSADFHDSGPVADRQLGFRKISSQAGVWLYAQPEKFRCLRYGLCSAFRF